MGPIDVTDEGIVRAPPQAVFQAIVDLMAGRGSWWSPHLFVRPIGEHAADPVGGSSVIRVPRRARFVARIEEVVAPSRLRVRYVAGDFRGTGLWTFEPAEGSTRIAFHWQVVPAHWWLRWMGPLVQRNHSRVMHIGFEALDKHLKSTAASRDVIPPAS
jgi:uncharacterized protein YndB with AHSA1/START domain